MIGYRNAAYDARSQEIEIFTWSEDGDRISYRTKFYPYIFLEDPKGEYQSIFKTKLRKKSFPNNYEKLKYIKETGIRRVFENFGAVHHCLIDTYHKYNETEEFSKFPIKIYYVDIECVEKNAMPDPNNPQTPINVITVYDNFTKMFYVWGLKPYTPKQSNVKYIHCVSEIELLHKFIEFMKDDPCDVLSGWNSSFFDIPYIVNRIHALLGELAASELSPIKRVYTRTFMGKFGREQIQWQIDGISCVDYLDIYKRFSFKNQESYKLDYIGEMELNEKKVDYGDRDLYDLMVEDWELFVDYNIQDVNLLVKLEEKLQYISLLRMLANVGLTTLEGAMGTLGVITGSTAIRARLKGQHIPTFVRDADTGEKNPGAYVADPTPGFQENVVTYDANSLYPNIMISLNMSPETKIGKIIDTDDESITVKHVNGQVFKLTKDNFARFIKKDNIAISKAKILFSQKTKGIVPDLVDHYYQERKIVQRELQKCKVELAQIEQLLTEL